MENLKIAVIDNGTGFTKMGLAGNADPSFQIPTVILDRGENQKSNAQVSKMFNDQLDYYIGHDALQKQKTYQKHFLYYPVSNGVIQNWELMEKFWHRSIFDYMRLDPEQHVFILTEPPMNPPENREKMAEIFFETFNAKGLYIGVSAVLALISNQLANPDSPEQLTGTIVDSGDGTTQIIPIADGCVIGSCIKSMPLAGKDITKFVMQLLRERKEWVQSEDILQVSREIKEQYGKVCDGNLVKAFEQFDLKPEKKYVKHQTVNSVTGKPYEVDVGYEQIICPEMLFRPEFVDQKWKTSIYEMIDKSVQSCPIDYRRKLYENVILAGGSTQFPGFKKRLQKELQKLVIDRLEQYYQKSGNKSKEINVKVQGNPFKQNSVWQGGSILATSPEFSKLYHTKQELSLIHI
eukprot:TRINITY_DN3252_c0_g1_i4.p2 TRINITY_DN3252_c0_g1~~TRINITY_DN3252_c0_g1_i4.p2  ORF type:complete len:406 (+),score=42.37 TRINITY_DN3252_c0_g1_i4:177-1394(+)